MQVDFNTGLSLDSNHFFNGYKKGYNKSLNLYYNNTPKTPTGSIIPLHSFAKLGETLLNQRFLFLSLVFLSILLRKRESQKESQKGGEPP